MVSEWERRWPGCRPIGHELRTSAHATWVRFHNLPDSRRYAEEDWEYAELLVRQNTVIDELVAVRHDRRDGVAAGEHRFIDRVLAGVSALGITASLQVVPVTDATD